MMLCETPGSEEHTGWARTKIIKQENLDKVKLDLSVFKAKAGTGGNLMGTKGSSLGAELALVGGERGAETSAVDAAQANVDALECMQGEGEDDDGGEDQDDTLALDGPEDDLTNHSREEPMEWEAMPETAEIDVEANMEPGAQAPTLQGRVAFVNRLADLRTIPTLELQCILCQLDDTITYQDKSTTWTKSKPKRHLMGPIHRREEQLKRAFRIDMDVEERSDCPLCHETFTGVKAFIKHCEDDHPEQLDF